MESTLKESLVINNNEEPREMSLVQPQSNILLLQDGEHRPDHLGPKPNACNHENAPNDVAKKDTPTEVVPTQPTSEVVPPRRIKKRTMIPSPHVQEKADTRVVPPQPTVENNCTTSSTSRTITDGVEIQQGKLEHVSVQIQGGVVPPCRVRKREETIPTEKPQKMNDVSSSIPEPPPKLSRKKGSMGKIVPVLITDGHLASDVQASCDSVTSGKPSIPLASVKSTKALSNTASDDGPSQTVAILHARVQGQSKIDHPNDLSGETDVPESVKHLELVSSEQKGQTISQTAENVSRGSDQSAVSPPKVETKESDQTKPESESFADFGVEPTKCLSIIRKIAPPRSSKKGPTVKSISKAEGDTCEKERNLSQVLKVVKTPSAQKSEEVAPIPLTQESDKNDIQLSLPIPLPRAKKQLSGPFLDAHEGMAPCFLSASKEIEAKPRRQRGRRSVTHLCPRQLETSQQNKRSHSLPPRSSADQQAVPTIRPRRSRLDIESKAELIGDDDTERSGLPVPKPRIKKHWSGSFPDNFTAAGASSPSSMDELNKMACDEMVVHCTEQSSISLPIPMPRSKKRLSATYPDSTLPPEAVPFTDTESCSVKREVTSSDNREATEFIPSLEASTHSEGGFVTIPGSEYVTIESDQEADKIRVSCEGELFQQEFVGDAVLTVNAKEESIEDWTFTDKSARTQDVKIVTGPVAEKGFASTATGPQEDWLHLEKMNESEHKNIDLGQEVGVEEVDFCLVSVAAGDVEEEW